MTKFSGVMLAVIVSASVQAQTYPTKSIRCIIPTAPGGGSDAIVRMIGQHYTRVWGQQVVVDHRPGAGMSIGIDIMAKSTPDGHTMAVVNPSHAINATLISKLPYDPISRYRPHHHIGDASVRAGVHAIISLQEHQGTGCRRQGQAA